MKKKTSIELINKQINILNSDSFHPTSWKNITCNIIEPIFGKDSSMYSQIRNFEFTNIQNGNGLVSGHCEGLTIYISDKNVLEQHLNNYIELIIYGDYPKKREIVITHKIIALTSTVILTLITGVFSLGMHFGQKSYDKEKYDLQVQCHNYKVTSNSLESQLMYYKVSNDALERELNQRYPKKTNPQGQNKMRTVFNQ